MNIPFSTPFWVAAISKLIPGKSPQEKTRVQNLVPRGSKYLEMGGELTPNHRIKSCSLWSFLHQKTFLFGILRPDFWGVSIARYLNVNWPWPFPGLFWPLPAGYVVSGPSRSSRGVEGQVVGHLKALFMRIPKIYTLMGSFCTGQKLFSPHQDPP